MTILHALAARYDRLAAQGKAPVPGFGPAQISFTFVLDPDGQVVSVDDERRSDKGRRPKICEAPEAPGDRRGEKIVAGTFWDPTDYALGVPRPDSAGTPATTEKLRRKAIEKHAAFQARHRELLDSATDQGCLAFLRFLQRWTPDQLQGLHRAADIPGHNVAFRLQGDRGFIHDRKAARDLLSADAADREATFGTCLVTGAHAPIRRLHSPIKGMGDKLAPLVSFDKDAFTSYGKTQGGNAPVSETAAFAYATALNALLAPSGSNEKGWATYRNRVRLGNVTVVFWAEKDDAEAIAGGLLGDMRDDTTETDAVGEVLRKMAALKPLQEAAPDVDPATRVYVLGLSANAARLSVRFWMEQSLGDLARRFAEHWADLDIEPRPRFWPPPMRALLLELAAQGEAENVPDHLNGEFTRAILTGQPYPRSLLAQAIMRIRADRDHEDKKTGRKREKVGDLRVALLKACLARACRKGLITEDVPVSLDLASTNPAYRLGRLFSALERLQRAALGQRNATIRDRFYAAASATPAMVFPTLVRNARNHSKKVRSTTGAGLAEWFEDRIAEIVGDVHAFPRALTLEDQGRFALGYYHQRASFTQKKDVPAEIALADATADTSDED